MKRGPVFAAALAFAFCPQAAFCAEGGEHAGSWLSLAFFAINFTLFVILAGYFGGPLIVGFIRDRAKQLRATLDISSSALKRAEQLAAGAERELSRLESEKAELARAMRAETEHETRRIRELARDTAERIRRDGELTAAAAQQAARREVRARLGEVAAGLARRLLEANFNPGDQEHLLADFMRKLSQETR
jgi:F0F1-type ATP synthase membrane subunit b/b'